MSRASARERRPRRLIADGVRLPRPLRVPADQPRVPVAADHRCTRSEPRYFTTAAQHGRDQQIIAFTPDAAVFHVFWRRRPAPARLGGGRSAACLAYCPQRLLADRHSGTLLGMALESVVIGHSADSAGIWLAAILSRLPPPGRGSRTCSLCHWEQGFMKNSSFACALFIATEPAVSRSAESWRTVSANLLIVVVSAVSLLGIPLLESDRAFSSGGRAFFRTVAGALFWDSFSRARIWHNRCISLLL